MTHSAGNRAADHRAPAVWLEGEGSAELDIARGAAERWFELERVVGVDSLPRVIDALRDRPLRVAFFAQPRRGLWLPSHVEHLHRASPLVQLAGVYGSWCEGWQRTGHPLPGVCGMYWHQLPQRLPWLADADVQVRTVTMAEQLSFDDRAAEMCRRRPQRRILLSAGFRERQALQDALEAIQWVADESGEMSHPPDAMVWDGDARNAADRQRLQELKQRWPAAPLLARTLAPRLEDWRQLEQWTPDILTRPHLLNDLYSWLRRRALGSLGSNAESA